MKIHELHDNVVVRRVVSPVAVGTTGVGKTGKVIDRQGFDGVEFIASYGSVTATNAAFTVTVMEGDVTGTLTSVADADMVPNTSPEAGASLGQAATRTSGVSKNVSLKVGYKGSKRYVTANIKSTITAAALVAIDAILFNPEVGPTTTAQAVAQ